MVILRLKENREDKAIYEYLPEGKDTFVGVLSIDKCTKKIEFIKVEPHESSYRLHACGRMIGYVEGNIYPERDMVAWY